MTRALNIEEYYGPEIVGGDYAPFAGGDYDFVKLLLGAGRPSVGYCERNHISSQPYRWWLLYGVPCEPTKNNGWSYRAVDPRHCHICENERRSLAREERTRWEEAQEPRGNVRSLRCLEP